MSDYMNIDKEEFVNLKVSFYMDTDHPLIINRFTTIDSILLSAYYGVLNKIGKRLPYDPEHKTVDFIHRKEGVFSGSIWYIERSERIYHDFSVLSGGMDTAENIRKNIGEKVASSSKFKPFYDADETMIAEKVYFYIRGSKKHMEALVHNEVMYLGKKRRLGYGKVVGAEVEEITEDKGFQLDKSTASKPLPLRVFSLQSKKIALFRPAPPYWETEGREACFMPTTALYEIKDTSASTAKGRPKHTVANKTKMGCQTNVHFIYNTMRSVLGKKFDEPEWEKYFTEGKLGKTLFPRNHGDIYRYGKIEKPTKCSITGVVCPEGSEGMLGDIDVFIYKWRTSFGDFNYVKNTGFVCKEALWCILKFAEIGFSFVSPHNDDWKYVRGEGSKKGFLINDIVVDHTMLKPPFSLNIKDSKNPQHLSFKGQVSISNGFFFVQFGNSTLQIDGQLLAEAVADVKRIVEERKYITKSHLCGMFKTDKATHPFLRSGYDEKEKKKDEIIIMEFHKKYNSDIRYLLISVAF